MSDVFISYSRKDQAQAERLARALVRQGWSVWWDQDIRAGGTFDRVIDEALAAARCVVALWSKASVESEWVREEADDGRKRGILVPVLIESTEIPRGFRLTQTADLVGWTGDESSPEFQRLVRDVTAKIGPPPPPPPPPSTPEDPGATRKWALWAAVAVALCAVLLVIVGPWRSEPESTSISQPETGPGAGEELDDCGVCPTLVVLPAGSFSMGSPEKEAGRSENEGPRHEVSIGRFALGKHEVTRGEFAAYARSVRAPSDGCQVWDGESWRSDDSKSWQDPGFVQTDDDPVVCVSWHDARKYAEWLSLKTGHQYRLPSEAEWEYAARARTTAPRFWGHNPNKACGFANVADRTLKERFSGFTWPVHECADGFANTAPKGKLGVNDFGLRNLLGNVWEWTLDCWHDDYSEAPSDGSPRVTGDCPSRVARGGSWYSGPGAVRAAQRNKSPPGSRDADVGFRVARVIP